MFLTKLTIFFNLFRLAPRNLKTPQNRHVSLFKAKEQSICYFEINNKFKTILPFILIVVYLYNCRQTEKAELKQLVTFSQRAINGKCYLKAENAEIILSIRMSADRDDR